MTPQSTAPTPSTPVWQIILGVIGGIIGLAVVGLKVFALGSALTKTFASYSIDNLALVEQSAPAFGQTKPIAGNQIRQGQAFALYLEPKNFKSNFVDGHLTASMIVDLELIDASGKIVDTAKAVNTFNYRVAAPNSNYTIRNAFANIEFNTGFGYAVGKYTLRVTLTERFSDDVTTAELPFEILPRSEPKTVSPATSTPTPVAASAPRQPSPSADQSSTPRFVR
jgi:hypothetical protein